MRDEGNVHERFWGCTCIISSNKSPQQILEVSDKKPDVSTIKNVIHWGGS